MEENHEPDDEILSLSPDQWVGLLSTNGRWLPQCCASISAARDALGNSLRENGRLSRLLAEEILREVTDHDGRPGEGLRAILLGASPGSGSLFWTAEGSPWFEIARACASLLGGADVCVENAVRSWQERRAMEREAEERWRPGVAAEIADRYAQELVRAQSARLLRPDERAFEELLRQGAIRTGF